MKARAELLLTVVKVSVQDLTAEARRRSNFQDSAKQINV
jgi:hypothetical protein